MNLIDVKKRGNRLRVCAISISIITILFLVISGLKSIYFAFDGDTSAFSFISHAVRKIVYSIYENTQFFSLVWTVAPTINPSKINTLGNFGFFLIFCIATLGRLMWSSAMNLLNRVSKTIKRVEELGWEKELLEQQVTFVGEKPDILLINIDLNREDFWYKKPTGLILIGIIIAVLAQLANLKFGLLN